MRTLCRNVIVTLTVSAASVGLGGCGENLYEGRIALITSNSLVPDYESKTRAHFKAQVEELCPKCEIVYANSDQDPSVYHQDPSMSAVHKDASPLAGVDTIVLDAVDSDAARKFVARAKKDHIAVVSYGRLMKNADIDYYVSHDPKRGHRLKAQAQAAAKIAVALAKGRPQDIKGVNGKVNNGKKDVPSVLL